MDCIPSPECGLSGAASSSGGLSAFVVGTAGTVDDSGFCTVAKTVA